MVIIMKKYKELVEDICVYLISLISVGIFFGELIDWMMYI